MKNYFVIIFLLCFSSLNAKNAIILNDGVRLRGTPEINKSNVIGSVGTSEEVLILESKKVKNEGWVKVQTAVRQIGWVASRFVGYSGDKKIKSFCLNNLKNVIKKRNLNLSERDFFKISRSKENSIKLINSLSTEKIPLDIAAYILLLERDARGVEILIESLKEKKQEEVFFALQVVAKDRIIDNSYNSFKKWISSVNKNEIKLDDFSLVRIFQKIR